MRRILPLCLLAALLIPAAAMAASRNDIYRDCQDGQLQGHYTPQQLRQAAKHIPTDVDEYSDCRDVLARAAASGAAGAGSRGGGGSGGGGGGAASGLLPGGASSGGSGDGGGGGSPLVTPSTPADHKALSEGLKAAGQERRINGRSVVPSAAGLAASSTRNSVPSSLLVVLILLGVTALAAALPSVRRRVLARRRG